MIVGIAILKLIQWRKSQTANSEYYDRNEPEGEFTGMGQETALELDPDTKDEDN